MTKADFEISVREHHQKMVCSITLGIDGQNANSKRPPQQPIAPGFAQEVAPEQNLPRLRNHFQSGQFCPVGEENT